MAIAVQLTPDEALSRAKIGLMNRPDSSFFVTLCFSMRHIWDNKQPTAYARFDTRTVGWNTDFFMRLDTEERVFLMLHEVLHIAYMHSIRLEGRDRRIWNQAADYAINQHLIKRGFKRPVFKADDPLVIAGVVRAGEFQGLYDPRFDGMSAEPIYEILVKENPPPPPGMPEDIQLEEPDPKLQDQIERLLVRAAMQSRISGDKPGTIPGDIELLLDRISNPRLPWHRILAKFFQDFIKNDYSMKKPNRRFMPKFYLPTLWSNSVSHVRFAFDMSGSCSDDDCQTMASETIGVFKNLRPKELTILQFDTAIKSVETFTSLEALRKLKMHGRGGTDITPVLRWICDNKPPITVIFTDGGFHMPDLRPPKSCQVVWLIHGNPTWTAPFGKVIHYEMQHGH